MDEIYKLQKDLDETRNTLHDILIQCNIAANKKAETEEIYRKNYSIALHSLKMSDNKYPMTMIVDLAKGKCHLEIKNRELAELEYDLLLEKMRNTRLEINILITKLSLEKEQMKLV